MSTAGIGRLLKPRDDAYESHHTADNCKEETDSTEQEPPADLGIFFFVEKSMVPLRQNPPSRWKLASRPQDSIQDQMIIKTGRYSFKQPQHQKPEADFDEQNGRDYVSQRS